MTCKYMNSSLVQDEVRGWRLCILDITVTVDFMMCWKMQQL